VTTGGFAPCKTPIRVSVLMLPALLVLAACGGTAALQASTAASKPASSTADASKPAASAAAAAKPSGLDALYQQAKAEGTLVWNSSQQDSIFKPVVDAFQKTYP